MSDSKRPEFLMPVTRHKILDATVVSNVQAPLYCGTCYFQLHYKGLKDVLPNTYAHATTPHYHFVCRRCARGGQGDIVFEKRAIDGPEFWAWEYERHYSNVLGFCVPTTPVSRMVEKEDGVRRYTTVEELTAAQLLSHYQGRLAELQKD
jgi:hypothetical protein